MKVAVSIPDGVFQEGERVSRRLRIPRSQFYSRALAAYVRRHSGEAITAKLNETVAKVGAKVELGWHNPGLEVMRREKW